MPRVVAVTGASSGVGRATARLFGSRGDTVAVIARNVDVLKQAAQEIEDSGGHALVVPCDVADAATLDAAAADIERHVGPIDVWINNAMVSVYSPIWELDPSEVERVTAVNYLGSVNGTIAALRRMRARDRGVILQVGSGLSHRAIPLQAAYCASKHAIRAFTESLRTELMHDGSSVRVTIVELPGLNTPHFTRVRSRMPRTPRPVAPIYTAALAARAVVYAADHPERREYVLGGLTAAMILAQKLAPGLLDRWLARTGFDSQMTQHPTPYRPGNLFETLPGDPGAEGPFGDEARHRSLQWAISRHRRAIAVAAVAAGIALRGASRRG